MVDEDEPMLPWPDTPNRYDVFKVIRQFFLVFTCMPVAMMMGKTHLEDKVACLLYQFWLEFGMQFASMLDVFASFTTDMGTPPLFS
jgi:hypothetical protein